jgi:hypothetical protein
VSVIEPSNAVKRRYGYQTGGDDLRFAQVSAPQLTLWLGWLSSNISSADQFTRSVHRISSAVQHSSLFKLTLQEEQSTSGYQEGGNYVRPSGHDASWTGHNSTQLRTLTAIPENHIQDFKQIDQTLYMTLD